MKNRACTESNICHPGTIKCVVDGEKVIHLSSIECNISDITDASLRRSLGPGDCPVGKICAELKNQLSFRVPFVCDPNCLNKKREQITDNQKAVLEKATKMLLGRYGDHSAIPAEVSKGIRDYVFVRDSASRHPLDIEKLCPGITEKNIKQKIPAEQTGSKAPDSPSRESRIKEHRERLLAIRKENPIAQDAPDPQKTTAPVRAAKLGDKHSRPRAYIITPFNATGEKSEVFTGKLQDACTRAVKKEQESGVRQMLYRLSRANERKEVARASVICLYLRSKIAAEPSSRTSACWYELRPENGKSSIIKRIKKKFLIIELETAVRKFGCMVEDSRIVILKTKLIWANRISPPKSQSPPQAVVIKDEEPTKGLDRVPAGDQALTISINPGLLDPPNSSFIESITVKISKKEGLRVNDPEEGGTGLQVVFERIGNQPPMFSGVMMCKQVKELINLFQTLPLKRDVITQRLNPEDPEHMLFILSQMNRGIASFIGALSQEG